VLQREAGLAARQRDALEYVLAVRVFGGFRFEELAPRRRVEIQVADFDAGAGGQRGGRDGRELMPLADTPHAWRSSARRLASVRLETAAMLASASPRNPRLPRARGRPAWRSCWWVTRQRQRQIVAADAAAVVGDPDELGAAASSWTAMSRAPASSCSRAVP